MIMETNFKIERIDSPEHRRWIASLPCIVSGYQGERGIDHHLMRAEPIKGTGYKLSDIYCVPMEFEIHNILHRNGNEEVFFLNNGLPYEHVMEIARNLAYESPDIRIRMAMKINESGAA